MGFSYVCVFISIADYGDKDNAALGERFGVKKDDFPVYRLFLRSRGVDDSILYTGDEGNADEIKKFIVKETGKHNSSKYVHKKVNYFGSLIQ